MILLVLILVQVGNVYGDVDVEAGTEIEAVEVADGHDKVNAWGVAQKLPPNLRLNPDILDEISSLAAKTLDDKGEIFLDMSKLFDNGFDNVLKNLDEAEVLRRLKRMDDWDPKLVDDLARRLGKDNYPDLADDLIDQRYFSAYDDVVHSPRNTGDILEEFEKLDLQVDNINHVAKSAFWSAVRKEADDFEKVMSDLSDAFESPPCIWPNPTSYTPHRQLYLRRVKQKVKGSPIANVSDGKIIIPDDVHIKAETVGLAKVNKGVIHDSKLSGGDKAWTPNQNSDLIKPFKDNPDLEYIEFEIRSDLPLGAAFSQGDIVRIYRSDIYKSIKVGNDPSSSITGRVF